MAGSLRGRLAALRGGAGQGVLGQGLNFAAMAVPLAIGDVAQITFVVLVAAVASIASRICGLAFPALYPVLPEEETEGAVTATVRITLAAGVVSAAGVAILPLSGRLGEVILWSAAMTVVMVLYQVVNGVFVRRSRYREYGTVRLIYGVVNLAAVVAVSLLTDWVPALAATGVLAYAVGWIAGERFLRVSLLAHVPRGPVRSTLRYVRRHGTAITGQSVDVVGAQMPALSVAPVGLATGNGVVWSGLQRISGGVVTTFMMLVAPAMDMRVAEQVRGGDSESIRGRVRAIVAASAILSAMAAVATVAVTVIILRWRRDFAVTWWIIALIALMCAALFLLSIVNKYLIMIGAPRPAAMWSALRAVTAVGVLLAFTGDALIVAVAVHAVAFTLLYLALLSRALVRMKGTRP
ncbi:hypothetical protein [Corynebacterium sp. 335C]